MAEMSVMPIRHIRADTDRCKTMSHMGESESKRSAMAYIPPSVDARAERIGESGFAMTFAVRKKQRKSILKFIRKYISA